MKITVKGGAGGLKQFCRMIEINKNKCPLFQTTVTIHEIKGYDVEFTLAKELDSRRQSEKHDSFTEKKLQNQTSFMVEKVCACNPKYGQHP